jgi:hypothetical protein
LCLSCPTFPLSSFSVVIKATWRCIISHTSYRKDKLRAVETERITRRQEGKKPKQWLISLLGIRGQACSIPMNSIRSLHFFHPRWRAVTSPRPSNLSVDCFINVREDRPRRKCWMEPISVNQYRSIRSFPLVRWTPST